MDVKFENRYVSNERMLRAFFFRVTRVNRAFFGVLILALLTVDFVSFPRKGDAFPLVIQIPVFLYIAYRYVAGPILRARGNMKHNRIVAGGAELFSVVRFGEAIETSGPNTTLSLEYAQIVAFLRGKHFWALMLSRYNGILLDPDGFTVGDPAAFEAFLREKCPNLK